MKQQYTHLTQKERYHIHAYKAAGFSNIFIAEELDRHVSTIKRELGRNTGLRGYKPKQAHSFAQSRLVLKPKHVKMTPDMIERIKQGLEQQWSPEQIQGRLLEEGLDGVCPKTIYDYIACDKASGGDLHKNLRHKKYKRRTGSTEKRGQICNRVSIEQRPSIVDEKIRIGDWEADTVIGKGHKGVLVTLSERVSKLNLIAYVPSKHAAGVTQAIITMLGPYRNELHTITFDNGKEFAYHEKIAKALNVDTYFAHPYRSCERGLNENHNGLIRQYLPKGEPLDKVTHKQVADIQTKLNQRPRKLLNYKTPEEIYEAMKKAS
ncbi:Helix-turn-helix, Fis-type [hydrothermal vent metagenome]|uniref:Helix-turn-helix, Fis-type n=2 Tax=hydrothermal vent metagenome TaxID=652676 RepID=A0A3B0XWL2_9ZZZZ